MMELELTPWDTLLYTVVIITLMVVLSKLLTEPTPAVRIRDNKVGKLLTRFKFRKRTPEIQDYDIMTSYLPNQDMS